MTPDNERKRPARPGEGAPSTYTPEIADEICERLSVGENIRAICNNDGMPHVATVFRWLEKHQEFRELYARAREAQAEYLFDEIIEIADDGTNDYVAQKDAENAILGWRENGEVLQRSRLRVDARKWAAAKLAPKKYGERQEHIHKGPNGPIETITTTMTAKEAADAYTRTVDPEQG